MIQPGHTAIFSRAIEGAGRIEFRFQRRPGFGPPEGQLHVVSGGHSPSPFGTLFAMCTERRKADSAEVRLGS
jgi:hypothetical protein